MKLIMKDFWTIHEMISKVKFMFIEEVKDLVKLSDTDYQTEILVAFIEEGCEITTTINYYGLNCSSFYVKIWWYDDVAPTMEDIIKEFKEKFDTELVKLRALYNEEREKKIAEVKRLTDELNNF